MKKNVLFVLCTILFLAISCTNENADEELQLEGDDVKVQFCVTNDFDISEMPWTRAEIDGRNVYYHFRIASPSTSASDYHPDQAPGHVGFFSDLSYANLKLKRGQKYKVLCTALISSGTPIDIDKYSEVSVKKKEPINVYNNFSMYLEQEYDRVTGFKYGGAVLTSPEMIDQKIERYYGEKIFTVQSNETIDIELARFSYKLQFEIDPPTEGKIVVSCDKPAFKHVVNTNDNHFSSSDIYSLGGFELDIASKFIDITLENFDAKGDLISKNVKNVKIKPNVQTTIKIKSTNDNANNSFNVTLSNTVWTTEDIIW